MRGKKVDINFVSDYISHCAKDNVVGTNAITEKVLEEISQIDAQIKAVEELKRRRSKLLDVITTLNKETKNKSGSEVIEFFRLSSISVSANIINMMKGRALSLDTFEDYPEKEQDKIFLAIKEMLKIGILVRSDDDIKAGDRFDEFWNFIKGRYI